MQHLVMVVLEDWQHVSWIPLQPWAMQHMVVVSVTVMVCSSRKSVMAIRLRCRITG